MRMPGTSFLELAAGRRSIRRYRPDAVPREKLDYCLEAARLAPSACNSQPCRFVVVDEPALKERFCAAAFSGVYSATKFAAAAPALVAVTADRGKFSAWVGNQVQDTNFRLIDIGIAAEHFVLAAAEQGLGTCWIGWFSQKGAAKALGLPSGRRVEVLLSVGYPAESPAARPRKTREEYISYNKP